MHPAFYVGCILFLIKQSGTRQVTSKKNEKLTTLEEVQIYVQIVAILAAIVGANYALTEYENSKDEYEHNKAIERVHQVLMLESRFSSGELRDSRRNIDKAWLGDNFSNYENHISTAGVGGQAWYRYNIDVIENKLDSNDVVQLVDFYTVLAECIKRNLCDKDTAVSFFAPYIQQFFLHHTIFICRQRRERFDEKFAEGVIELVLLSADTKFTVEEYAKITCDQVEALKILS